MGTVVEEFFRTLIIFIISILIISIIITIIEANYKGTNIKSVTTCLSVLLLL